jgi:hypothetical protein
MFLVRFPATRPSGLNALNDRALRKQFQQRRAFPAIALLEFLTGLPRDCPGGAPNAQIEPISFEKDRLHLISCFERVVIILLSSAASLLSERVS